MTDLKETQNELVQLIAIQATYLDSYTLFLLFFIFFSLHKILFNGKFLYGLSFMEFCIRHDLQILNCAKYLQSLYKIMVRNLNDSSVWFAVVKVATKPQLGNYTCSAIMLAGNCQVIHRQYFNKCFLILSLLECLGCSVW